MAWGSLLGELRESARPRLVVRPEPPERPPSVALVAGSFDPITVGHAAMADAASSGASLVLLVYSVRTLPKDGDAPPPLLAEEVRLACLERFCEGRARLAVGLCSHGLLAEQVDAAADRFPGAELSVVVGSDKLLQLFDPRWYEGSPDDVLRPMLERAEVRYAIREGDDEAVRELLAANPTWRDRFTRLEVDAAVAAVSSRRVRDLLRRGADVGHLVPSEIVAFLADGQRSEGGR